MISEKIDPTAPNEVELNLLELATVLARRKFFVLKCALMTAVLTAIVMLLTKPSYTAIATFLPPNSMSPGASLFGQLSALSGGGGALGSLRDPTQIYLGILKSRSISDDLIAQFHLSDVYKTKKLSSTEKALKSHSAFTSGKDMIVSIQVTDHDPQRSADLANAYLAALKKLNDRLAVTEASQKRLFFEQQLVTEKNALADAEVELARQQQQSGLIMPTGQTQLQIQTIAQLQAEIASREVTLTALNQGATEQNPDVVRLRSEIAGLKSQLNKLESSNSQGAAGSSRIPTSKMPELTLDFVRKARDVKYHEALYELLLRQYESAKMDESKSAPLVQVVDYAVVPDTKSWPLRTIFTALGFVLGGFAGAIWTLTQYGLKVISEDPKSKSRLASFRSAILSWR